MSQKELVENQISKLDDGNPFKDSNEVSAQIENNPEHSMQKSVGQNSQKSSIKDPYFGKQSQNQDDIDNLFGNENDPEHVDMIKQYNMVKKERKNIENNQKLLENRINLLKQEEVRTLKKIEETRKKALEIYYLKQKNEEKQRKKEQERDLAKSKNQAVEEQRKHLQQEHKMMIDRKKLVKKEAAEKMKRISEAYQTTIDRKRQDAQKKLIQNRMDINKVKENAKKKEEERLKQKKMQISNEIKNKIDYESKIKNWKEREIEQLETYEMDLIQRLQNTQQLQKTAFDELESALTMPAKEFAEKFLKPKAQAASKQEEPSEKHQNLSGDEDRSVKSKGGLTHNKSQPQLEHPKLEEENKTDEQIEKVDNQQQIGDNQSQQQ